MTLEKVLLALSVVLIGACTVIQQPVPKPTTTVSGGAPAVEVSDAGAMDDCARAGARLQELDCRRADGTPRWLTPKGAPFADYCRAASADGRSPRPDCIAKVSACSQVDAAMKAAEGTPCVF